MRHTALVLGTLFVICTLSLTAATLRAAHLSSGIWPAVVAGLAMGQIGLVWGSAALVRGWPALRAAACGGILLAWCAWTSSRTGPCDALPHGLLLVFALSVAAQFAMLRVGGFCLRLPAAQLMPPVVSRRQFSLLDIMNLVTVAAGLVAAARAVDWSAVRPQDLRATLCLSALCTWTVAIFFIARKWQHGPWVVVWTYAVAVGLAVLAPPGNWTPPLVAMLVAVGFLLAAGIVAQIAIATSAADSSSEALVATS